MTFAYGTVDTAALGADIAELAATAQSLYEHAVERDADAAEADASALLSQAEALEAAASDAERRMTPLDPDDSTLVSARSDAVIAYGLTADYAAAATDLANAALSLNLQELVALAQEATDLIGTSEAVATSYGDLALGLEAWATAHPTEAALALATYA